LDFMCDHGITSIQSIPALRTAYHKQLEEFLEQKKEYCESRQLVVKEGDPSRIAFHDQCIALLSEKIKFARKQIKMCDEIVGDVDRVTGNAEKLDNQLQQQKLQKQQRNRGGWAR